MSQSKRIQPRCTQNAEGTKSSLATVCQGGLLTGAHLLEEAVGLRIEAARVKTKDTKWSAGEGRELDESHVLRTTEGNGRVLPKQLQGLNAGG